MELLGYRIAKFKRKRDSGIYPVECDHPNYFYTDGEIEILETWARLGYLFGACGLTMQEASQSLRSLHHPWIAEGVMVEKKSQFYECKHYGSRLTVLAKTPGEAQERAAFLFVVLRYFADVSPSEVVVTLEEECVENVARTRWIVE